MRRDLRGRQACKLSPYHQRLHNQAVIRAELMREMLAAGLTCEEVGRRFGCSGGAVYRALKRHPKGKR